MQPAKFQLDVYRGDTGHWQFAIWADVDNTVAVDLSKASAKSEIRDAPAGASVTEMLCAITAPNLVDLTLLPVDSHLLPAEGVWDLQLTWNANNIFSPVYGDVVVTPDVTDSAPASAPSSSNRKVVGRKKPVARDTTPPPWRLDVYYPIPPMAPSPFRPGLKFNDKRNSMYLGA